MVEKKPQQAKIHCTECRKVTNHDILEQHKAKGYAEAPGIYWWATHEIIKCRGCDEISFRKISGDSEEEDPDTGHQIERVELYPNPADSRQPMADWYHLPVRTARVYLEVLKALSHGAPILAAIGLRAVVESVCLEQNTKSRNLAKAIDELAEMGHLSKGQAQFLHQHRFMGNVAAHEMVAPKSANLIAALEIVETLLKTIYVLPSLASSLRKE